MGKIKDKDIVTVADLAALGLDASSFPNADKIYITSLSKTLAEALADGDIVSSPAVAPIDAGSQRIGNVEDPGSPQDAATKNYVDAGDTTNANAILAETSRAEGVESTLLPLAGGTMSGNIDMGNNSIYDVSQIGVWQASVGANGSLTVGSGATIDMGANPVTDVANPSNPQDAATKSYVDTAITTAAGANTALSNLTSTAVNADILPGADNTINLGNTNLTYASVNAHNLNVASGGGNLATIAPNIEDDGLVITSENGQSSLNVSDVDGITITAINQININGSTFAQGGFSVNNGLNVVSGNANFNGTNQINALADPTLAQDAATKNYVDTTRGQGATGVAGATGVQGVQGIQGEQGFTGVQGVQGIQGNTGDQGSTGIQGVQGFTGVQGATGIEGATGVQGATGVEGMTGVQGATGIEGATGVAGDTGIQGVTGLGVTGPRGPAGIDGATGIQGIQGATGVDGATGAIGPQGITGIQGSTGAMGDTGLAIQGVTGIQGATGIEGSTGLQGVQGETGIEGTTGVQGIQGDQGQTGLQGVQGIQGGQGDQGVTGLQGATGVEGATGIAGATGVQGIQGDTGIQGSTGIEGSTGLQGIAGATGISANEYYPPTVQKFLSGSGTYTLPSNPAPKYIKVKMVGAGGGGSSNGSSTNGTYPGGNGGTTTFGSFLTAQGGGGGNQAGAGPNNFYGGAGGNVSIGSPAIQVIGVAGSYGSPGPAYNASSTSINISGGSGGSSFFGGAGGGGTTGGNGYSGAANSGAGGGGAGVAGPLGQTAGTGGGAGGYIEATIPTPSGSYSYTVGSGGAGGNGAGGNGADGIVIVEEYYDGAIGIQGATGLVGSTGIEGATGIAGATGVSANEYIPPTIQTLSGTGTYTLPSNPTPKYIKVTMAGGGAGGGSQGPTGSPGAAGLASLFGSFLTAGGGSPGTGNYGSDAGVDGGAGGSNTIGSGPIVVANFAGSRGGAANYAGGSGAIGLAGGSGGSNPLGGAGAGGFPEGSSGWSGVAGTGAGGGGAGYYAGSSAAYPGSGGGAGGFIEAYISSPASTYSFTIGQGGAGATGGGAGADGSIIVTEYYDGAIGIQGVTGVLGATGIVGSTGIEGATGIQGATGPAAPDGANINLSNLASTAINTDLVPATTDTSNLGSGSIEWSSIYGQSLIASSSVSTPELFGAVYIRAQNPPNQLAFQNYNGGYSFSAEYPNAFNVDFSGLGTLTGVVDPVNPQDGATKNYVDGQIGPAYLSFSPQVYGSFGGVFSAYVPLGSKASEFTAFANSSGDLLISANSDGTLPSGTFAWTDNDPTYGMNFRYNNPVNKNVFWEQIITHVAASVPGSVVIQLSSVGDAYMGDLSVPVTPTGVNQAVGTVLTLNGSSVMQGDLNMGTNSINNVVDPTNPQDAATKNYVDTAVSSGSYLPLSGGTLTGNLNMGSNSILSSGGSIETPELYSATQITAGSSTDSLYINNYENYYFSTVNPFNVDFNSKGSLTNFVGLNAPGVITASTTAYNLGTNDGTGNSSTVSGSGSAASIATTGSTGFNASLTMDSTTNMVLNYASTTVTLDTSGVQITNAPLIMNSSPINSVADPVNPQDAATKNYVDTAAGSGANTALSNLAGTTSINSALIPSSPLSLGGGSNPWGTVYADEFTIPNGGSASNIQGDGSGNLSITSNSQVNIVAGGGTAFYMDSSSYQFSAAPASGINAGTNQIHSVADPTSAQDAATKNYVDTAVGGIGSGANTSLSNLSSTAVNTDLLPAGNNSQNLGGPSNNWATVNANTANFDSANIHYLGISGDNASITFNSEGYGLTWGSGYVQLNSGTSLDANSNMIHNLSDPGTSTDAATKNYVDNSITSNNGNVLLLNGTQNMTGALNMNSHQINYVTDPTSAQDAATKNYVDTSISGIPSGANVSLSNLSSTAINTSLLPATSNGADLGTYNLLWNNLYATQATDTSNFQSISFQNRILADTAAGFSINWATRNLYNSSNAIVASYSGSSFSMPLGASAGGAAITSVLDPVNPQDAATKNYVDGSIKAWYQQSITLASGDITNQYIDLSHLVVTNSLVFVFDGLMLYPGTDYTLSTSGGVTRVTFAGDYATGGSSALATNDVVFAQYQA